MPNQAAVPPRLLCPPLLPALHFEAVLWVEQLFDLFLGLSYF